MGIQYAAMESSCSFSFADLFWSAHGHAWSAAQRTAFMDATQSDRNDQVRLWAEAAGGVSVVDRPGTDGQTYAAFCFTRPDWWDAFDWRGPRPAAPDAHVDLRAPDSGAVIVVLAPADGPLVPRRVTALGWAADGQSALPKVLPAASAGSVVHAAIVASEPASLCLRLGQYLACPMG
ncbi:MAG: hypothetical protein AB8G96_12635 [Phycisphaerales bacterium]